MNAGIRKTYLAAIVVLGMSYGFALQGEEGKKVTVSALEEETGKGAWGFSALVTMEVPNASPVLRAAGVSDSDAWGVVVKWEGKVQRKLKGADGREIETGGDMPITVVTEEYVKHDDKLFRKFGERSETRPLPSGTKIRLALPPGKYTFWFITQNRQGGSLGAKSMEVTLESGHKQLETPAFGSN